MENPSDDPRIEIELLVNVLQENASALIVALSHSWGGLEQVAASDAVELGALGIPVRFLCLQGSPIHENLAHRPEVDVLPIDFTPRNCFDLRLRKQLVRLSHEGLNLVHCHQTSLLGSIVPWFWKSRSVAVFATRHIMSEHNKKDFFHSLIYRRLDALIVMSQTLRQNVLETHPIRERQLKVINLGLNFEKFNSSKVFSGNHRSSWGADDETTVIGLVGRIDPAKGQSVFLKAAAGLLKKMKPEEKLKFVVVGEETLGSACTHLEELKAMVSQFRIEPHIVFTGYQENIPEIMKAFDIFVMPSRQEAFGLVAIEAMAMECPIVISTGGSAEEIVGQDEFGLTMRPNDAFDLQRQLRFLLDHPAKRKEMGRKAREHVMKNYDQKTRLLKTLRIYERALRRRGIV